MQWVWLCAPSFDICIVQLLQTDIDMKKEFPVFPNAVSLEDMHLIWQTQTDLSLISALVNLKDRVLDFVPHL